MSIFKNPDLYPTPKTLAIKMLNKVKHWGKIKSILEPSAGMGDLVEAIKDKCPARTSAPDVARVTSSTPPLPKLGITCRMRNCVMGE